MRYFAGMHDADGGVNPERRGQYFYPEVKNFQSNFAYLTAVNNFFDGKGYIIRRHAQEGVAHEGKYSYGELSQELFFAAGAAREVATQLLPHTVIRAQHFKIALACCDLPADAFAAKLQLPNELKDLNEWELAGDAPLADNIEDKLVCGYI